MKNTSKVMYLIGRILNIINIVTSVIVLALAIVACALPAEVAKETAKQGIENLTTPEQVKAVAICLIVIAVVMLALYIIAYVFAKLTSKTIEKDEKSIKPHVIMLVFGVFTGVFYLLGGIFGIVSVSGTTNKPTVEEK